MSEFQNLKMHLPKDIHLIGVKKSFKKIKNIVLWTYISSDLNGEEIVGSFYEKELQKTNQKEFRIEKVVKRKKKNCMSNGKDIIILLIAGFIKRI